MDEDQNSRRNRRLAFVISGAMDTIIGAAIVLIGLGVLPVNPGEYGLPTGLVIAIGGIMLISGMAMAVYHFTRLGE
jgi:hypothetical protein